MTRDAARGDAATRIAVEWLEGRMTHEAALAVLAGMIEPRTAGAMRRRDVETVPVLNVAARLEWIGLNPDATVSSRSVAARIGAPEAYVDYLIARRVLEGTPAAISVSRAAAHLWLYARQYAFTASVQATACEDAIPIRASGATAERAACTLRDFGGKNYLSRRVSAAKRIESVLDAGSAGEVLLSRTDMEMALDSAWALFSERNPVDTETAGMIVEAIAADQQPKTFGGPG